MRTGSIAVALIVGATALAAPVQAASTRSSGSAGHRLAGHHLAGHHLAGHRRAPGRAGATSADSNVPPPPTPSTAVRPSTAAGPAGPSASYACHFDLAIDAFVGADGTASAIGWQGNHQGVVTCLGGTFLIQDGLNQSEGFGIYGGGPTTWVDAEGYLPAQITTFEHSGGRVTITEFADRVVIGRHPFVAVFARVTVTNLTGRPIDADPQPSAGLVPLAAAPTRVRPHSSAVHDYVVASDRFGNAYPWPSSEALARVGSFDAHYDHMRNFWRQQLAGIAAISVPDPALADAYRSGFVYTQIARSGDALNTGVNGYESEFSHDVIGILTNLFTQGSFADARALLTEARNVVGSQGQYVDGLWTYALPWATYLLKTGDLGFVRANFAPSGRPDPGHPSIEESAHQIAADRTGPAGTMEATDDIDTQGYWTVDDYEALLGLAAYRYVATRMGDQAEARWAEDQYDSLLSATDHVLAATVATYGLHYLPCSLFQPNTANRCANPEDANWTSPFGFADWAWEGGLLGAEVTGPGASLIDPTYTYGFARLRGLLPPDTTGGFPTDYFYSSVYDAVQGTAGLAGQRYRDQGILDYEFMIRHSQSGPYSYWESSTAPSTTTPWIGQHPAAGQGASPHAWGIAGANKVLLDSLVAQRFDGALVVGRGIPNHWLTSDRPIRVIGFPTVDGHRIGLTIRSTGRSVRLELDGQRPAGPVLFQVPAFVGNIASASAGTVEPRTGTVRLGPGTERVTVQLRRAPGGPG